MSIDFYPNLTYNDLDKQILNLLGENSKKSVGNALKTLLNPSLLDEIFRRNNLDLGKKSSEFTKEDRKLLIEKIKDFDLEFDRLGSFESAVVTRGGIDVTKVNPKNMQSKLVEGLFFAGEILDIDCLTGGFNLQICFSTAYAAGTYIKENT